MKHESRARRGRFVRMNTAIGKRHQAHCSAFAVLATLIPHPSFLIPLSLLLAVSLSASTIFITNERAGTITVLDSTTDKVTATIATPGRPRGMAADGTSLYVAVSHFRDKPHPRPDEIVAIDLASRKIVRRYDGGTDPEGVAITPDGKRLLLSNEDAGTASLVDVASGRTVAALVVGTEPEGVAVSHDGRIAYVTGETSNSVSVIDVKAGKVLTNFFVDARPRAAIFTRDDARAYVTSEIRGTISVVDAKRHRVTQRIRLGGTAHPVGMALSPDGKRLYVATGRGNSVAILDTATNRPLKTIAVGQRVWGIALTPDGRKLYAANGLSNDVSVIDTKADRVVATVKAGDGPWGALAVH